MYKSAIENQFNVGNAEAASPPRAGPNGGVTVARAELFPAREQALLVVVEVCRRDAAWAAEQGSLLAGGGDPERPEWE
jgi:hypothetical protein